jgi:hypothetical protein
MARSFPEVLRIFYERFHSIVGEERAHAASAIEDVAENEPSLLDPRLLVVETRTLEATGGL